MEDDNLIPISALQHYLYCPRQCALIHVEQQWAESRHTAEGRLLHDKADKPQMERRRGVRTVTAMPLADAVLGIAGIADVVEFHDTPLGPRACPVEYKRGRPKAHQADEVQLCAQAMCLESMLGYTIAQGSLYYGETRRRALVQFDSELRELTRAVIRETRAMFLHGVTPKARYASKLCDACSLIDLCQPKLLQRSSTVEDWLITQMKG